MPDHIPESPSDPASASSDRFARERLAGYSEEMLEQPVLLLGAGALGGALALQLAMWGFREAIVVDHDHYELSNAARVLDFPYGRLDRGECVAKAVDVAARWRRRARASGAAARVRAVVGYVQELAPPAWRQAAVVLGAVDHPRARYDLAQLARRYGRPLITGGFDATMRAITVQYFPGDHAAACHVCTQAGEPAYAASDTSCTAVGKRLLEARKVPATPTMAAATASLMLQRLVDGLCRGFGKDATTTQLYLEAAPGRPLGSEYVVARNPDCTAHRSDPVLPVRLRGRTLGAALRSLENELPGSALVLQGALPIDAPTDDGRGLLRVALPPWRCPARLEAGALPAAPAGAYPLALPTVNGATAARYGLEDLPAAWLGLGPGAVFDVTTADGTEVPCEWVTTPITAPRASRCQCQIAAPTRVPLPGGPTSAARRKP